MKWAEVLMDSSAPMYSATMLLKLITQTKCSISTIGQPARTPARVSVYHSSLSGTTYRVFGRRYWRKMGQKSPVSSYSIQARRPRFGSRRPSATNLIPAGETPCPAGQAVVPQAVGRINCNEGVLRQPTNTGVSVSNGMQLELRYHQLRQQVYLRTKNTYSKTTCTRTE